MVNWAPFLWGIKYNIWVFYRDNTHLPIGYSEMLQHLPTPAWSELSLLGINPQSSSFLHRTKPHCWRCSPSCHSCPAQQQSQEQQQERNSPRTTTHTHTHTHTLCTTSSPSPCISSGMQQHPVMFHLKNPPFPWGWLSLPTRTETDFPSSSVYKANLRSCWSIHHRGKHWTAMVPSSICLFFLLLCEQLPDGGVI